MEGKDAGRLVVKRIQLKQMLFLNEIPFVRTRRIDYIDALSWRVDQRWQPLEHFSTDFGKTFDMRRWMRVDDWVGEWLASQYWVEQKAHLVDSRHVLFKTKKTNHLISNFFSIHSLLHNPESQTKELVYDA